jgi:hypothetical protein
MSKAHDVSGWFAAGLAVFALGMGALMGVSSSPVVGVTITAAFGLVVAAFGAAQPKAKDEDKPSAPIPPISLALFGKTLVGFTLCLVLGTAAGAALRLSDWPASRTQHPSFPWGVGQPPASDREALDWVIVGEQLHRLGFSDDQVNVIYKLNHANASSSLLQIQAEPLSNLFRNLPLSERPKLPAVALEPPRETKPIS